MTKQIHTRFSTEEIIDIFKKYEDKIIDRDAIMIQLKIGRRQFFNLLKKYRDEKDDFSIKYSRITPKRISVKDDKIIKLELEKDKELVENIKLPISEYNYSAIRDTLINDHDITVSVPTIINGTVSKQRINKKIMK